MDEKLTKDEKKALRQEEWKAKAEKESKANLYKTIGAWSFGALMIVLGIWALVAFSNGTTTSQTTSITLPKVTAKDFQSYPGAKVTVVEYADFECPACKAYYPIVKQLQQNYGNKLNVVYRMFPLKTVHPNAINSARAGYASALQGKFWEMHDKLFETQDTWAPLSDPETTFIGYAKNLGLDTAQFQKDYESNASSNFANTSYDAATNIGLNSTPTFFLNGTQIDNPNGYQPFKDLIDKALK